MKRREFITLLGGAAAAWPLVAHAQQPAMPVVGWLHAGSPEAFAGRTAAFRQGLGQAGFVEGLNVAIEYRWANNDNRRLPELAADLVNRRVAVIAAPGGGSGAVPVAKAATTTIPIVFSTGGDPVQLGFVASLNRPGGNITGINDMNSVLTTKRLDVLFALLPRATRFALLVNPTGRLDYESVITEAKAAASAGARQVDIVQAASTREIDLVFAGLADRRIEALAVHTHPLFNDRRIQLITLAAHYRLPTIYPWREAPEVGGLLFYGTSGTDEYRQVGVYVGRILKGEKPADLPVIRAAQFEFVVNLQTARTLGIDVPPNLLALADEVVE
jgi:putative ABC transport system substrate-binding protein